MKLKESSQAAMILPTVTQLVQPKIPNEPEDVVIGNRYWLDKFWIWFLILGIVVNCLGLFSPILEPDGALYATIAKHMVLTGDYVNLYSHGQDWLDKPHFPFWATALSFSIFGIHTLSYKLPALLFWGLGIYYTYRFSELFYSKATARLATLMYVTALHLVLSNNDVRAEPYLTGLLIGAMFHSYLGVSHGRVIHLIIGSALAAAAVMTKGVFVLIIIFAGLFGHWFLKKQFSKVIFLRLLCSGVCILVFTLPELLTLYYQFDAHPEKIVFGTKGNSGIKFFLWDSQFGRFFNTGPIRGEGDPFFFVHTTLWAFFPWSFTFFAAWFLRLRKLNTDSCEVISLIAVTLSFLMFSLSKFQLPHYLNIVFPLMCILVAHFILQIKKKHENVWMGIFGGHVLICVACIVFLSHYTLPTMAWPVTAIMAALVFIVVRFGRTQLSFLMPLTLSSALVFYSFLNLWFVPTLMKYQAGSEAAFFLRKQEVIPTVAMLDQDNSDSFDFYFPGEVQHLPIQDFSAMAVKPYVFCQAKFINLLEDNGLKPEIVKSFSHYKVSQPSMEFMNSRLRDKFSQHYFLIKIQ